MLDSVISNSRQYTISGVAITYNIYLLFQSTVYFLSTIRYYTVLHGRQILYCLVLLSIQVYHLPHTILYHIVYYSNLLCYIVQYLTIDSMLLSIVSYYAIQYVQCNTYYVLSVYHDVPIYYPIIHYILYLISDTMLCHISDSVYNI